LFCLFDDNIMSWSKGEGSRRSTEVPAMMWRKPAPTEVRQAISIYIDTAYEGAPPSAIRAKVDTLIALSDEDFYTSPLFEREPKESPARLSLRLGNQHYPHMKLVVE